MTIIDSNRAFLYLIQCKNIESISQMIWENTCLDIMVRFKVQVQKRTDSKMLVLMSNYVANLINKEYSKLINVNIRPWDEQIHLDGE